VIWEYLLSLKLGSGSHEFGGISKVAKAVQILPNSSAREEGVFLFWGEKQNIILALPPGIEYTRLPVVTIKTAHKESSFEPPADLLTIERKLLRTTTKSISD